MHAVEEVRLRTALLRRFVKLLLKGYEIRAVIFGNLLGYLRVAFLRGYSRRGNGVCVDLRWRIDDEEQLEIGRYERFYQRNERILDDYRYGIVLLDHQGYRRWFDFLHAYE
jgi:hypothetical protein